MGGRAWAGSSSSDGVSIGASEGHPRPESPHPLRAGMGTQPPRAGGRVRTGEVCLCEK